MNVKRIIKWGIVLCLLAALPGLTAALAQEQEPAINQLPVVTEPGESAATIPWTNTEVEPNNTVAQVPLDDYGNLYDNQVWGGKIGSAGDVDYWRLAWFNDEYPGVYVSNDSHLGVLIDIEAQSFGSAVDTVICLYSDDGYEVGCNDNTDTKDSMLYFVLEGGRNYFLRVQNATGAGGSNYKYQVLVSSPLLISAAAANLGTGYVDGIPFQAGDILAHSDFVVGGTTYQKWVMFLDLSDLNVKGNLTNLSGGWRNSDNLLVGFAGNVTLPGITGLVKPWEVVRFDPTQIGPTTAGTFYRWWNGNNQGLTTTAEKIDAIDWPSWNGNTRLFVSTTGTALVYGGPTQVKLRLADEDIGLWDTVGAKWARHFDGTNWGIDAKDVIATSFTSGSWYDTDGGTNMKYYPSVLLGTAVLSFGSNTYTVTQKDIVGFEYYEWWDDYDGDSGDGYKVANVWHGPDHGWNYKIDAIDYRWDW